VAVPAAVGRHRAGIRVHRQLELPGRRLVQVERIPVTDLVSTLVDLASVVGGASLERSINEADRKGLLDPEKLAVSVAALSPRPGLSPLRRLLERESRSLTDSDLERRFRRIARAAGLPAPETQVTVNGYRVDFLWPEQALVVEVDGLRYHRTPLQQAADRRRDQAHTAAGLTALRLAQHQIAKEPEQVESLLRAVLCRSLHSRADAHPQSLND
jgi:very-short-patch-repair endonuclease